MRPPIRPSLAGLQASPTLRINEQVREARRAGRTVYHMGFGESPFPVHPKVRDALIEHSTKNAYLPSVGLEELRTVARRYLASHLGIEETLFEAVVGPGSKELIFDVQLAVEGDLLFPVPSWVSYIPQTRITRDEVVKIWTRRKESYLLTPSLLEEAVWNSRRNGGNPTKLILNYPNNPTGVTYSPALLADLAEVCKREGILVISDEIYGLVTFDGGHQSIAAYYPEGTIVTTGLSKHLSLGGFRLGIALVPKSLREVLVVMRSIASETFSSVSTPIQYAAIAAFLDDAKIESYIRTCTAVHGRVARYLQWRLHQIGVDAPTPEGAFYLYADFSAFGRVLSDRYGVAGSDALAEAMLERQSVATLPGTAFGDRPDRPALRLSATDYDGAAALKALDGLDPADNFVEVNCPRVVEGANRIGRFLGRNL